MREPNFRPHGQEVSHVESIVGWLDVDFGRERLSYTCTGANHEPRVRLFERRISARREPAASLPVHLSAVWKHPAHGISAHGISAGDYNPVLPATSGNDWAKYSITELSQVLLSTSSDATQLSVELRQSAIFVSKSGSPPLRYSLN